MKVRFEGQDYKVIILYNFRVFNDDYKKITIYPEKGKEIVPTFNEKIFKKFDDFQDDCEVILCEKKTAFIRMNDDELDYWRLIDYHDAMDKFVLKVLKNIS